MSPLGQVEQSLPHPDCRAGADDTALAPELALKSLVFMPHSPVIVDKLEDTPNDNPENLSIQKATMANFGIIGCSAFWQKSDYKWRTPGGGFSIKDLQLFNLPSGLSQALLIGTKFAATDKIYANGVSVRNKNLVSPNLYELTFPVSGGETVTVTIVQGTTVLSKTIPNPATLKVVIPTVTFYQPAVKNKPAVLIVKLEGVRPTVRVSKITGAKLARPPVVSASGITLRLLNPEPPVAIQLEDSVTGATTVAVVDTLPAVPAQEEPKPKPKKE